MYMRGYRAGRECARHDGSEVLLGLVLLDCPALVRRFHGLFTLVPADDSEADAEECAENAQQIGGQNDRVVNAQHLEAPRHRPHAPRPILITTTTHVSATTSVPRQFEAVEL